MISHHLIVCLVPAATPTKATVQLNRSALGGLGLKGLPVKMDVLKASKLSAPVMDDSEETKRKLETLDLPDVHMSMTDGQENVGNLEGDDDDDEPNAKDKAKPADAMDEDEDEIDPLDAFMTGVKEEVKKVNLEDMKKMKANGGGRMRLDSSALDDGIDDVDGPEVDELDATDLNPEDILALAAKKAKKKDLAAVDHSRIAYEPFRKEFYIAPPDVATMTDEEADLLRLELDGIKIRGMDCPRPVTKWSHFGLPASWCVFRPNFHPRNGILTGVQFGGHKEAGLHSPYPDSSTGHSRHHVRPRRHWRRKNRVWQDHCLPLTTLPTHQGSATPRANGRSNGCCYDPNTRTCRSDS